MKAIGLMSGTSMDGVDVALIESNGDTVDAFGPAAVYPYAPYERQLMREAVESARGLVRREDRSGVLSIAERMITAKHAECVHSFVAENGISLSSVDVVGFHGQTVVHKPEKGMTVQLGDGRVLAAALGVPVVFDFRAADMARGGQGAPFVPVFHCALALMAGLPLPAVFVNIGGITNVTFIPDEHPESLIAFDAGPGNCLLDDWALKHTGEPMDRDAQLAMKGTVSREALAALLAHPYFTAPPPKSLDRGTFSLEAVAALSPTDGAATLTAFTVAALAAAMRFFPAKPQNWILAGGGARNLHMIEGIRRVLGPAVVTAAEKGFSTEFMEAQAFAYLAARHLRNLPASFPGTTGVPEPVVGGVLVQPESQADGG